jgi:hypothetical protein
MGSVLFWSLCISVLISPIAWNVLHFIWSKAFFILTPFYCDWTVTLTEWLYCHGTGTFNSLCQYADLSRTGKAVLIHLAVTVFWSLPIDPH